MILVTGATGNNGRALLPLLAAAGVRVRALVQPAHVASAQLPPSIAFVDVPGDALRQAVRAAGMPAWQADGLLEDYAHYHRGEAADLSPAVAQVTGRPPRTFRAFAREFAAAFGPGPAHAA